MIKANDKRYTQGLQRGEYQTIQPVLRQLEELREVMKGFEDPFKMVSLSVLDVLSLGLRT